VEGLALEIDGPAEVSVGEEFVLTIRVRNERDAKAMAVSDVDIADEYLEAFMVVATEPAAKSSQHIPIDNSRSFSFDRSVPPGGTQEFQFVLRAVKTGFFRGDVDVCEGARFTTAMAQTAVR